MFSKAETLGVQGFLLLFFNINLALLGLSRGRQGFQDLCCLSWDLSVLACGISFGVQA